MKWIINILLGFLLFYGTVTQAQTIAIHQRQQTKNNLITYFNQIKDQSVFLHNYLKDWYKKGYLTAHFDSVVTNHTDTTFAYFNSGDKYSMTVISRGEQENGWSEITGLSNKTNILSIDNFNEIIEQTLTYYENNGYPFVSVYLDSVKINQDTISAILQLNKNIKIVYDSLKIKGDFDIVSSYLKAYLNIRQGQLYNESIVKKIDKKLKDLDFITTAQPTSIVFNDGKANIGIYANKKQNNQVDGMIGFLPNNQTTGKLLLSGELRLQLTNALKYGENIDFNWRRLQPGTQDLKLNLNYPYILGSLVGINYKLDLFKQDSSFVNIKNEWGLRYLFSAKDYITTFIHYYKSSVLTNKSFNQQLANLNSTLYGLAVYSMRADNPINPRTGYLVNISAGVGNKNILDSPTDSVTPTGKSTTGQFTADLHKFLPLGKRSTFLLQSSSAMIANKTIFANELFRIGGLKTLRGFDEGILPASAYSILTLEYRYLLEKNSNINLFWNSAWYENKSIGTSVTYHPYGFGAGMTFETKAGIFTIQYALGAQSNQPIQLKSAKIHFGFINRF